MEKRYKLVVFWLDKQRFALDLSIVDRVVRMVEVNPLPKVPEYVLGTINLHGEFIPVLNVRKLFSIPEKNIDINDQLIITNTTRRKVAIWVDSVSDIIEKTNEEIIKTDKILLDIEYVEGIFKFEDGMVFLHDFDQFLTLLETKSFLNVNSKLKL